MKVYELFEELDKYVGDIELTKKDVINGKIRDKQPTIVTGDFYCNNLGLTTLENTPTKVTGYFNCYNNKLTSLEGAPTSTADFYCVDNPHITSLEGIGTKYLTEIKGCILLNNCPIKSHILGLLKIQKLTKVEMNSNKKVENIVNKYLKSTSSRKLQKCKAELEDAGLEEFAQL